MGHHGEPRYVSGDKSPEQQQAAREEWKRELAEIARLQDHSCATQAVFTQFVLKWNYIESLGINPSRLAKIWKI